MQPNQGLDFTLQTVNLKWLLFPYRLSDFFQNR